MHKEIEKAVLRITQVMERNRKAYEEAKANYNDTGHGCYWNKMQKLDDEYEELKAFLLPDKENNVTPDAIRKLNELKVKVRSLKTKWEYLRSDLSYSNVSVGIDDIFRDIKQLLN